MNKHVVSLKIARKLKKAGWNKETEYWWIKVRYIDNKGNKEKWIIDILREIDKKFFTIADFKGISAPFIMDILDDLPLFLKDKDSINDLTIWNNEGLWTVDYGSNNIEQDKSLPDALAKMWIYLKEKNLLRR